jgi:Uma2 family endonuclease
MELKEPAAMSAVVKKKMTEEEYLAQERVNAFKSEFFNGEVFAMAGASINHNVIKDNLIGDLHGKLAGAGCRTLSSDQRLKVNQTGLYTYPDIMIVCEKPERAEADSETIVNPQVIIEVLSDKTESYDRYEKFEHYKRLSSVREYVLVAQNRIGLERYLRNAEGAWIIQTFTQADETFSFASVPVNVKIADIYSGVEFPPVLARPQIVSEDQIPPVG